MTGSAWTGPADATGAVVASNSFLSTPRPFGIGKGSEPEIVLARPEARLDADQKRPAIRPARIARRGKADLTRLALALYIVSDGTGPRSYRSAA